MENIIYYFSATGNSLYFARNLADKIGQTKLISIPEVIEKSDFETDAERVGIIFPVYAWGLPRIVIDFVKKLKLDNNKYLFAIATCGGTPAGTLNQLNKLLKKNGADLDAGFIIKEASHVPLKSDDFMKRLMRNLTKKTILKSGKERLSEIVLKIKNKSKHEVESNSWLANSVGSFFYSFAIKMFKILDSDFRVDDKCNACGICQKVCPRNNVRIENNKPVWHHNCEYCFACFQWCPKEAIQYQQDSENKKRTHHPEISVNDLAFKKN